MIPCDSVAHYSPVPALLPWDPQRRGRVSGDLQHEPRSTCGTLQSRQREGSPHRVNPQPDPVLLPFPGGDAWGQTYNRDALRNHRFAVRLEVLL